MNRIAELLVAVLVGCILAGCSPSKREVVSDHPEEVNCLKCQVTLEREVSVAFDKPSSDSGDRKLTESLAFVCRIQPVGSRHPDSTLRYRLLFEEVSVSRTDFLHELSSIDPVTELAGRPFEVVVDDAGRVVEADELLKSITALARGCESCPQGDDCGQRKIKEHNFLLDMWSIQELFFRANAASRKLLDQGAWNHDRQLPSVLPGEPPSVTTEWQVESGSHERLIVTGNETMSQGPAENPLPVLHHPHVKPKGLLGYLRNCTYDSVKGHVAVETSNSSGLPSRITHEGVMNATAYYTLSRPPKKTDIQIWEKLTIETQE